MATTTLRTSLPFLLRSCLPRTTAPIGSSLPSRTAIAIRQNFRSTSQRAAICTLVGSRLVSGSTERSVGFWSQHAFRRCSGGDAARRSVSSSTQARNIALEGHPAAPAPSTTASLLNPTSYPSSFIQSSRATFPTTSSATSPLPTLTTPIVSTWLYASSALVLIIVILGGVTRLTESGLSITEWEPVKGILPPIGREQWEVEWEKYRVTPEGVMANSQLDMTSFKRIYYMEWAHRIAGRLLGVGFILPAVYFLATKKVSRPVQFKLLALAGGIGFQGALGWYMVKSGLSEEILTTPGAVPRVSQYRLAAHLGGALLLYTGMLHTAMGISRDWKWANPVQQAGVTDTVRSWQGVAGRFRGWSRVVAGMVLFTAVSGAFVAGLDAGLIYNEFPLMGGRLVPLTDELMDPRYAKSPDKSDKWWRNMLENPTTVQFDHRAFAMTTFAAVLSLPFLATRPALRKLLPKSTVTWAKAGMYAGCLQVTMGITTLLYLVPVPLAAAHQAGSVVLLTTMIGLITSMRRPGKAARLWRQARASAQALKSEGSVAGRVTSAQEPLKAVKGSLDGY